MSLLFPRAFYREEPAFTTLFRVLDDIETHSREAQGCGDRRTRRVRATLINPRFDVRETEDAYELHGELPGVSRENLQMEFTEPQTLVIRGRVERNYSAGSPPAAAAAGLVDEAPESEAAATPDSTVGAPTDAGTDAGNDGHHNSHQATVSDEETEAAKENGEEVASEKPAAVEKKQEEPSKPRERYWHQERSVGQFRRVFTFPAHVDESAVSANLDNGILHVTIPKAKRESHRITIN